MIVSDLLRKLEIPINLLRLLGDHVNIEIKNKDQILNSLETECFQELVLKDDFSKLVTQIKAAYSSTVREAYSDDKNHYFIGHIKWFSDPDKIKDYGFATIKNIGDVYFHRKDVYQSNPDLLKSENIVFIRIPNENAPIDQRKRAFRINLWTDEENVTFLAYLKIYKQVPLAKKRTLDYILTEKLLNLDKNQKRSLYLFIDTVSAEKFDSTLLDFYINLYKMIGEELKNSTLLHKFNTEQKFEIWLKNPSLIPFEDIEERLKIQLSTKEENITFLDSLGSNQKTHLFESVLSKLNAHSALKEKEDSVEEFMILFRNALKYDVSIDYESLPQEVIFKLWKTKSYRISINSIKKELAKILPYKKLSIPEALLEESKENQQKIFEYTLEEQLKKKELEGITFMPNFITLFKRANKLELKLSLDTIGPSIIHSLWRHKVVDKAIVAEIYNDYWRIFKSSIEKNETNITEVIRQEYAEDLQRLDQDDVSNLLAAHFHDIDNFNQRDYQFFEVLLGFNLSNIHREKLINLVKTNVDGYGKLRLFVDNHVQSIDFNDAVLYTALLNSEDQKLFFKKCLSLVEKGEANWKISDFKRIVSIDYELYAQSKTIGDFKLDFSLSLILHITDQIANGQKVNKQSIFQIVADVINDPKELLKITGFFDKCHGRQSIKKIPSKNSDSDSDPQEYKLTHYEDSNPRFATYCEGRKAINNQTKKPSTCASSGKEFHWCENVKCYHIARREHENEDWKNYSLADVLRILEIDFLEEQYEQLIGSINKANHFFEHLNCRECDHILHPKGNDNYGFYRVSNFYCKNHDCDQYQKEIYLSHCANGACLDIVDSRDTVRCITEGNADKCGWYVCNNCHTCCTTKNINSRAYRLEKMGQQYNCHKEGHWDRQKLCCNKCGTEMNEYSSNYDVVLQWFLDKKETHPNITNSGVNGYNKNWFIWQQGSFSNEKYRKTIENLKRSGFNIPDYEDQTRRSYLVAEPRYSPNPEDRNLRCPECGNDLLIRKDVLPPDQYYAIKKYHFNKREVNTE